ncbi:MAG: DNA repair protein RecO [Proteobacteria bacterium]|nr:DNA repair protein RecO [Cystobacterineae bacterium]MCL2259417.1 DNA repair protein RecO [Cystobacterineae bacterium]MCL2314136.1 DNA repair protein RecO [Pseudomonadota bacterium]
MVVDDAVVTLRRDFSEADRVLELLTFRHGKVSVFAARAKSSRKRFGGGLELGSWLKVWLRPKASALWRLEKVELVDGFLQLRQSLEATAKGMYALELCREICQEGEPMGAIFPLLMRLMKRLQQAPHAVGPLMKFELTLLGYAGWPPQLHFCERCKTDVLGQSAMFFLPEGVVCMGCSKQVEERPVLSKEALETLHILQGKASKVSGEKLLGQRPSEAQILEMRLFLDEFWFFHLGKKLKARVFMDEMVAG